MIAERLRGPHPALRLGLSSGSGNNNVSQPVPPRRPPLPGSGGGGALPRRQQPLLSGRSSLAVSRSEYVLGCQEPLTVSWDIKEELSPTDWIGLYRVEENDPMRFLECINRRPSTSPKGYLPWLMECQDLFLEDVTSVCFRYYHGASGALRAVSPVVTVRKPSDTTGPQNGQSLEDVIAGYSSRQYPAEMVCFYLSNIQAKNLKRRMFFTPTPYMKISVHPGKVEGALVLPHHGQQCRTGTAESTVHPSWPGRFEFIAYPSDSLEFEVKDKVAKNRPLISRFLGKLSLPVSQLLDQSAVWVPVDLCFGLTSKNLSDNITGQLSFTFTRDSGPGTGYNVILVDPWSRLRQVHNPIYVSDLPDAQSLPGTPQHPHPQLIARMPSLPNGSILCSSSSSRQQSSESRKESRNSRQLSRQSAANPAFTNLEYMLQSAADADAASRSTSSDLPPPLPPKQKPVKGAHKPLERAKALSQEGQQEPGRDQQQQTAKCRHPRPEDSFLLEIVDTDEQNGCAEEVSGPAESDESAPVSTSTSLASFTDSSPPPALPQRTSSGAQRPSILQMTQGPSSDCPLPNGEEDSAASSTFSSRTAPLATPEHDSIQDSVPSLENLSEDVIPEVSEEETAECEETQPEDSSLSDHPDPESYLAENNSDLAASPTSSSLSSHTLSASENEAHPGPRDSDSDTESDDSTSPCDEEEDYSSLDVPHSDPAICSPDSLSGAEGSGLSSSMSVPNLFPTTTGGDAVMDSPSCEEQTFEATEDDGVSPSSDMPEIHITSCSPLPPCPPTPVHQPHPRNHLSSHETWDGHSSPNTLSPSAHMPTTRLPSIPERTIRYQRVDLEEPLPSHWEARIDSHGRIFYIDHLNRTTTWTRPTAAQQLTLGATNELQRQQLDRRYQSIRRTITSRAATIEDPSASSVATTAVPSSNSSPDNQRTVMLRSPAVRFITRPDFFNVLHMNDEAIATYNRSSSLKHMITKIRRDPCTFERYQHNRDLVSLLNKFADTARDLPRGWETKLDRSGKQFFIDHTSRSTSFIDPRLPVETPYVNPHKLAVPLARRRSRSAGEEEIRLDGIARGNASSSTPSPVPPPRPPSSAVAAPAPHVVAPVPTAYNDKVVAFLRQPNIMDILKERHLAIASNGALRDKVNAIRADGTAALDRLSHDLDLTILLSLFEEEIMSYVPIPQPPAASTTHRSPRGSPQPSPQASPGLQRANVRAPAPYRRDFEAKLRNFYRKLESKGYGQGPGKLKLNIRRDHLLEDAFTKIMAASKKDLQKSRLYISFAAEEGLDYGGPSREFFFLLSRELFNPYYGLFEYSANDTYTVQVSPMSAFVDNQHEWFRFSGRVLGLALVHQYLLDAFFTRPFYKALLRLPCSLSDLEYLDAEFHQSLLWLKENDISEMGLDLSFCVTEEVAGQIVEKELKPGGRNTAITERNKKEYIERMVKWRLERGVAEQTECLVKGFYEVVDPRLVSVFDARELELVIAGTAEIDTADWRKNTEYRSGYHDNHPVIQWFWLAIEKFDNEQRLRLLQFVTGTSSIPYEGFSALRGSNGPRKFCIEKWGKPTSLPRAHTCFNRLDLPPYASFDLLNEKLLLAVEESSTFGIE